MRVYFSQIYIEQGAYFPFSHLFHKFMSDAVSQRVAPSPLFLSKYGADYSLIFRISAKHSLDEVELRGPTVFKKTQDVEYTIFLPFPVIMSERWPPHAALDRIVQGVCAVFDKLGIDAAEVRRCQEQLVAAICADSTMFQDIANLKRFNDTLSYLDERVWTSRVS